MSGQTPPSSHSGDPLQPINPYEPSRAPAGVDAVQAAATSSQRHYSARLDWADRQALLRSVGPTRLMAVLCAILWLKGLLEYANGWRDSLTGTVQWQDGVELVAVIAVGILWTVQGLLSIYACRLSWVYAESLQSAASGRTDSWNRWSFWHFRTSWWGAVLAVVAIAVEAGNLMLNHWYPVSSA